MASLKKGVREHLKKDNKLQLKIEFHERPASINVREPREAATEGRFPFEKDKQVLLLLLLLSVISIGVG